MVNKNKNLVFTTLQVVVPSLKNFNDSQELFVVSLVASLDRDHFLRKKDYKV